MKDLALSATFISDKTDLLFLHLAKVTMHALKPRRQTAMGACMVGRTTYPIATTLCSSSVTSVGVFMTHYILVSIPTAANQSCQPPGLISYLDFTR